MARTYLPASEQERDDLWLDLIESGVEDTASIADKTGFTRRRIQQRVKAAKERREDDGTDTDRRTDPDDLERLEIVHGQQRGRTRWVYRIGPGEANQPLPAGLFAIANGTGHGLRIESAGSVRTKVEQDKKSEHKHKPRSRQRQPKKLTPEEVEAIKAKGKKPRRKSG